MLASAEVTTTIKKNIYIAYENVLICAPSFSHLNPIAEYHDVSSDKPLKSKFTFFTYTFIKKYHIFINKVLKYS